eukprot:TRINITY_DN123806_c0_g1_i1.p1 TRINITY_DN123806_c0_g1~~TRINITY_DN123806_c0_g1_i1.p1  ORF type:complete len:577 (-),score=119.47 TRINITY_DN123806_c0_g1_i1:104-1714(-)
MSADAAASDDRERSRSPRRCAPVKGVDPDLLDGWSLAEIMRDIAGARGYTFDDLICLPGHIDFAVHDVSLSSHFTKNIAVKVPLASSPMDTVTESRMAINMALQGGIGCIHRNCTVREQCEEVRKVKRYEAGMNMDPFCVRPEMTLADLEQTAAKFRQFIGFPVTADGKVGSQLLGMVTKRDVEFATDKHAKVEGLMTKFKDLVKEYHGVDLAAAQAVMQKSKKGRLPIVSKEGKLVALITRADVIKHQEYPHATKDKCGRLCVAAAVGVHEDDRERLRQLVAAGVDAVVLPHRQGDSVAHMETITWIKKEFAGLDVVGGNVTNAGQAKRLIEHGVDALRVGMGSGSMSTSQDVTACGRAQASAVYAVAQVARAHGIPVIADGGLGNPGQILKSLMVGADMAMCGNLLAGTEEAPGEYNISRGQRVKAFRGMGSLDALSKEVDEVRMKRSAVNVMVARGVSGNVVDRGSLKEFIPYITQGLKHGMQDVGCTSVDQLHSRMQSGHLRFELRSAAAQREGSVHGLHSFTNTLYAKAKA